MREVSKDEVEARLKGLGAFWATNVDDQHAVWMLPNGFQIWVPLVAPDATMYEDDLIEIEEEIRAAKYGSKP